jgi:hypothetical protein
MERGGRSGEEEAWRQVQRLRALVASNPSSAAARAARVDLEMGLDTFFLSTTCKDVSELGPLIDEIEVGHDHRSLFADLAHRGGDVATDTDATAATTTPSNAHHHHHSAKRL